MLDPFNEFKEQAMFAALTSSQLKRLVDNSHKLPLSKSQVLFNMGEESTHFYYLKSGRIKIARSTQQGMEKVLTIVHPGQLFAEAVMFLEHSKFPASAIALEACEVISFESRIFTTFLRESQDLSMAMFSNLTKRLHEQIIEIENLTMQNANYRLLNYIDRLLPAGDIASAQIEFPGPKATIASRLSITPETFSRALHALNEQKLIKLKGKSRHIEIPDIALFKHYLSEQ